MGWQDAPLTSEAGETTKQPSWRDAPIVGEAAPQAPAPATAQPEDIEAANKAFLANNAGFGLGEKLPSRADLPNRAQRVGLGMAEPAIGLGQLAAHATGYGTQTADAAAKWVAQKEAEQKAEAGLTPEDWDYWSGAGSIASPVNFLPGAGIARVVGPAKSIVGAGLRGVGAGAAYGAMQPVSDITPENDYWAQKQGQAETGAIAGGVTGLGAGALAKAISPAASKTPAQLKAEGWDNATIQHAEDLALMNKEGIRTTFGQTTQAQRSEGMVGDVPFAGGQYRQRIQDFREDANRAAINRSIRQFGGTELQQGDAVGIKGIDNLYGQLNDAYHDVHSRMSFDGLAPTVRTRMMGDLQSAINNSRLVDAQKEELRQLIKEQLIDKLNANHGILPGDEIQGINSVLREESRGYGKDQNWDKRKLSYAIDKVQKAFSDELQRQNGTALSDRLKAIDNGYAYFVRLRAASVAAKANNGVFTGNQLLNASTQMNRTVGKSEIARGKDPFYQDLAGAMTRLTSKMPNSGSPERGAALAFGAHLLAGQAIDPTLGGGMAALTAAYTNPVQRALNAAVTKRPPGFPTLGRTLRTYGPTAGTRALMTGKVGQDQEPEMLPPVRVEQAAGGRVAHPHAQRLSDIESASLSPEQKRDMRRKIIEDALRNP